MILAAIDIGSNAARLLISKAEKYNDDVADFTKVNLLRIPLRLGFDVFQNGFISEAKADMLLDTMRVFRLLLKIHKVDAWKACATSAMRDASNSLEIIDNIKKQTDIDIEIISGSEEASILYETDIAEHLNNKGSYLYIDVGGGSTELTMFSAGKMIFKESFNIGTIRMLSDKVLPQQWEYMKWLIKTHTKSIQPVIAIGTGGNINKVFSLSKTKEGKTLSLDLLRDYYRELSNASLSERIHIYRLKEDRADVIVPALQIYTSAMRWAGAEEIYVPKIGLADGLIKVLYQELTQQS